MEGKAERKWEQTWLLTIHAEKQQFGWRAEQPFTLQLARALAKKS